ncbi:hypothetical protein N658DRAFT_209141 [Parathielavia hyrcaniae]|uniref:Uncharacterized protein n=1 Tax=Parathielavia hyrcaniae TaxID=113614 RepID=A0AAN6SZR3_9PEZI|nr:hypothetical protein N658DRAFT_209141 [Parathielavia hyrcaniae]
MAIFSHTRIQDGVQSRKTSLYVHVPVLVKGPRQRLPLTCVTHVMVSTMICLWCLSTSVLTALLRLPAQALRSEFRLSTSTMMAMSWRELLGVSFSPLSARRCSMDNNLHGRRDSIAIHRKASPKIGPRNQQAACGRHAIRYTRRPAPRQRWTITPPSDHDV